jgi:hypothetical protein
VTFVLLCIRPDVAQGQTLAQVLDLGSGIGARLTEARTEQLLNSAMFAAVYSHVSWFDARSSTVLIYEFASDPIWSKVVFSRKDSWLRGFNNASADPIVSPRGLAVTGTGKVLITDPHHGRVLAAAIDESQKRLIPVGSLSGGLGFPIAVAWDGGSSPLTQEAAFVVDTGVISYWTASGNTWSRAWSYGSPGSGSGQFLGPSGICVGHQMTPYGDTFNNIFYVADAGNHRLVALVRDPSGIFQLGTVNLSEIGGVPADCTVDAFGNVYVADSHNSQIRKYTYNLELLATYGTYGTATSAGSDTTFAHPHSISIPYGIYDNSPGNPAWYGEGRILTAEDWGPNSGGREHWLGVVLKLFDAQGVIWGGAQASIGLTDHASFTTTVHPGPHSGGYEQTTRTLVEFKASGWPTTVDWDGRDDGGGFTAGWYHFHLGAQSPYGCDGSPWCHSSAITDEFYVSNPLGGDGSCTPDAGPGCMYCTVDQCFYAPVPQNVALPVGEPDIAGLIPTTYHLGQVLTPYAGPLLRMEGAGGAATSASTAAAAGSATAAVRANGIRALSVAVPSDAGGKKPQVSIKVYSLAGRLVRDLVNGAVDPGEYVIGWDGLDATGRAVQPGVYIAVMTAGTYRGIQRLIIK